MVLRPMRARLVAPPPGGVRPFELRRVASGLEFVPDRIYPLFGNDEHEGGRRVFRQMAEIGNGLLVRQACPEFVFNEHPGMTVVVMDRQVWLDLFIFQLSLDAPGLELDILFLQQSDERPGDIRTRSQYIGQSLRCGRFGPQCPSIDDMRQYAHESCSPACPAEYGISGRSAIAALGEAALYARKLELFQDKGLTFGNRWQDGAAGSDTASRAPPRLLLRAGAKKAPEKPTGDVRPAFASRARAIRRAYRAPPRNARGRGHARYARNRVPPSRRRSGGADGTARERRHIPGMRRRKTLAGQPEPRLETKVLCSDRHENMSQEHRKHDIPPLLARAIRRAYRAPPRNARGRGHARYARNRVPPPRRRSGGADGTVRERRPMPGMRRRKTLAEYPEPGPETEALCLDRYETMRQTHGKRDRT